MPRSRGLRGVDLLLAALLAATGCSPGRLVQSRPVPADTAQPVEGMAYYLPKKLLRIQVWKFSTSRNKVDERGAPVLDDSGRPVPEKVAHYFALHHGDGSDDIVVPDLRHHFVIVPRWDGGSHDTLAVSMTPEGLLTRVSGTSVDETSGIVRAVVDLARLAAGVPPSPMTSRGLADLGDGVPRYVAGYEFDPTDPVDGERVRSALAGFGITFKLTRQADCPVATSGGACCTTCNSTEPGVYYRLPIPYRLSLSPAGVFRKSGELGAGATGEWESLDGGLERTVLLPNEAVCMYVPVDRAPFVTSKTEMTFEQGMLTSVSTDKPSEVLGFVRIPVDAMSAILAIPADLLTVRIKKLGDEKAAIDAQTAAQKAAIDQQIQLLDAMRRLRAAQNPTDTKPSD